MRNRIILIVSVMGFVVPVYSQRVFSLEVDSLNRSYLLVGPSRDEPAKLPLVIVLHDEGTSPFSLEGFNWSRLQQPAIIALPIGLRGKWACKGDSVLHDEAFLMKLIFQVQNNFRTDPTRVFIIGMGDASCLADRFSKKHPALVRATANWSRNSLRPETMPERTRQFDSLIFRNPASPAGREAAESFSFRKDNETPTEFSYADRTTLSFHIGRWDQSRRSRKGPDTVTLTDLGEYHFMFGFAAGYYFNKHWSFFIGSDFLIIPKERTINGISWGGGQGVRVNVSGKGGIVVPYGIGLRYSFPRRVVMPFLSAGIGSTFMFIGGGSASGGPGNINKSIVKRKENLLRYSADTGCDIRLSPNTFFQLKAGYTFSSIIEPELASVDRFEGLSFSIGLLFILGK